MLGTGKAEHWAVYLHTADNYHRPRWPTITGAKRHRGEGAHGITAALSPLVTPSKQAVRTHVACQATFPCRFLPPWLAHTPAGWGHGGTRNRSTSRSVQTRSVSPAAMAGVRGCPVLAEPWPWVGRGWRRLAWGRQKL